MTSTPLNSALHRALPSLDDLDPLETLRNAEHADWALLRLVMCAALATLMLAAALSMGV